MNMKIKTAKRAQIIKNRRYYYHTTQYAGWLNTVKVECRRVESEEVLDNQIVELGYNMFLSEDEAKKAMMEILAIYDKYKDK